MKQAIYSLGLSIVMLGFGIGSSAQSFPPDLYGEDLKESIGFWENKGQVKTTDELPARDVVYYTEGAYPRAYFRENSIVSYVLALRDTTAAPDTLYRLDMECVGANASDVDPTGYVVKPFFENFYLPWTDAGGVEGVEGYSRLVYEDVYPGVDLHYYSGPNGQKMAFVCHPGSDPTDITLEFTGQDDIEVDWDGALKLFFGDKWVEFEEAVAFQYEGNTVTQLNWTAAYDVDEALSISRFTFDGYDPELPLVLQIGPPPAAGGGPIETPGLCWSTYFGGDQSDVITSSTQDAQGSYFVAGRTGSGPLEFPAAPGSEAYPNTGGNLAFLVKMDDEDRMVWRIFLGGEGGELTIANAVVVKDDTEPPLVYIAGSTTSSTLSTWDNSVAYYDDSNSNSTHKGFIAAFNNDANDEDHGTRTWCTYIGESDVQIHGMAKDADERLFLTGETMGSLPPEQLTAPPGSDHYNYGGGLDAFVILLNEDDQTLWVTPYGGSDDDFAKEVVANAEKVVIAGETWSSDMIVVDGGSNAWDRTYAGEISECFIAEFDMHGAQQWGTCFAADEHPSYSIMQMWGKGLALDPVSKDIVIGASVFSIGLPIVPGPGWYDDTALQTANNSFLARFSGNDRSLTWSTYLAGINTDYLNEIRTLSFDASGNLFVAGRTRDLSLPVTPLGDMFSTNIIQADLFQPLIGEASDMFIMSFTPDHWLAWCTYFGGQAGPFHEGLSTLLHRNGDLYAAGFTSKSIAHFDALHFTSYFPLHDTQVAGVHFTETYGDVPDFQGNASADAFITRFCASDLTGMNESPLAASSGLRAFSDGSRINLVGLPLGAHEVTLLDATGRLVHRARATSDGTKAFIALPAASVGIYLVCVPQLGLATKLHLSH